jgi:hypothetical protein
MRSGAKRGWMLLLVFVMVLTMAACGDKRSELVSGSPDADDAQKISITGLKDQEFEITVGELKSFPKVTKRAEAMRANGEKVRVKATGPLLEDVLQKYGKSLQDFSTIRLTAKDRYSIAVPPDILKNRSIILAYEIDGKPLDDENRPVRVVIPGERAMYWVRMLEQIDLETGVEQTPIKKVVFLETAAKNLPQEDYEYFESIDKAVKTRDLVAKYAGGQSVKSVFIKASDGLQKNETNKNFLSAYLKITGKEAPKFLAPHFPQGMHVRDLLYINYGGTAFFAYRQGIVVLPEQMVDGRTGIALSDLIKETGLARGDHYRFSSADGESVELAVDELGKGLVYETAQGALAFCCGGSEAKTVDDLLSIECLPN